jgi:hypothetical protein
MGVYSREKMTVVDCPAVQSLGPVDVFVVLDAVGAPAKISLSYLLLDVALKNFDLG